MTYVVAGKRRKYTTSTDASAFCSTISARSDSGSDAEEGKSGQESICQKLYSFFARLLSSAMLARGVVPIFAFLYRLVQVGGSVT